MKKGDVILIPFPFTNLSGNKNRPAVILIDSTEDVTICFITTRSKWKTEFDISVDPSEENGLKKISLIRLNKIATIDKDLVIGRLGSLEAHYIEMLNKNLKRILKLE